MKFFPDAKAEQLARRARAFGVSREEAVARVLPEQIDQLLHPVFDQKKRREFRTIAKGLNASPGAAAGKAVFTPGRAVELAPAVVGDHDAFESEFHRTLGLSDIEYAFDHHRAFPLVADCL